MGSALLSGAALELDSDRQVRPEPPVAATERRQFRDRGTKLAPVGAMLHAFAGLALLFALLDHFTTWLCLRTPIPGWEIREANPLAAWLFQHVGLIEGLAIDTGVTALALMLVAYTARLPRAARLSLLGLLIGTSAFAVANNVDVIQQVGLV